MDTAVNVTVKKRGAQIRLFAMKKTKTSSKSIAAVLAVMAVGLVLASTTTGAAHAQTGSATKNVTSAAKSMTGAAGNKTMGAANKTSEGANSAMTNATQGNQSASNSTNPLAKVPIIGKLFGGK
jgi:hypothetical protein